jgi:hypothetical protein
MTLLLYFDLVKRFYSLLGHFENLMKHRLGEFTGLSILLAWMVGGDESSHLGRERFETLPVRQAGVP